MNENLFDKLDKIVFTSATLAVDEKFKYFKESIGLDKTKLEYNIEEKEGNLDFDVNIMTGEIRLKVKSGINAGVIFSIKDRGTNKVYPISLVIKAVDRKK